MNLVKDIMTAGLEYLGDENPEGTYHAAFAAGCAATRQDEQIVLLALTQQQAEAVAIALKLANRSWNFEYDVTHRRIERPAYRHVIAAETAERELKDVLAEIGAVV